MTAVDFTVELFCRVDDVLCEVRKHPLADLHPSEVVTLGMLHALRGEGPRAFYRWVEKELGTLFPRLPERTRLFRLLVQCQGVCQQLLAQPSVFGVADSFGIELVHPWREKRTPRQVARKGLSNHRWIVGAKLAVVTNGDGRIVSFEVAGANVHDTRFHPMIERWDEKIDRAGRSGLQGQRGQSRQSQNLPQRRVERAHDRRNRLLAFHRDSQNEKTHPSAAGTAQSPSGLHLRRFQSLHRWNGQVKLQLAPFAL